MIKGQTATIYKTPDRTKDRETRTPLKTVLYSGAQEGWAVPVPVIASVVLVVTNPVISHEWGNACKVLATSGTYP